MTPKTAKEKRQWGAIQRLIAQANVERQKAEDWRLKPWDQRHEKEYIESQVAYYNAEAAKIMQEVNRLTVLVTKGKPKPIRPSGNYSAEQFLNDNAEFNEGL
jgi:hypothetical protein